MNVIQLFGSSGNVDNDHLIIGFFCIEIFYDEATHSLHGHSTRGTRA